MADTKVDKLTKGEREVVLEAMELKRKSLERAQRANTGAIAAAYGAEIAKLEELERKLRNFQLEL